MKPHVGIKRIGQKSRQVQGTDNQVYVIMSNYSQLRFNFSWGLLLSNAKVTVLKNPNFYLHRGLDLFSPENLSSVLLLSMGLFVLSIGLPS